MGRMLRAAVAATSLLAASVPAKTDAVVMDAGKNMCVMSAADTTGAWACRPDLRPSRQSTPEGVLLSTRLRIEECEGVKVETRTPGETTTHVSGSGTNACLDAAVTEVNKELEANAIGCETTATASPTKDDANRFKVSATCENKDSE